MATRKKTRINTVSIVITFVEFLNVVKMYHWNTRSYSEHKATDELYEVLGKNIDKFVEIMLGDKRLPTLKTKITIVNTNRVEFMAVVNKFKIFTELSLRFKNDKKQRDIKPTTPLNKIIPFLPIKFTK